MHNKRLKKRNTVSFKQNTDSLIKKISVFMWSGSGSLPVMLNRTVPTEPRNSAPLPQEFGSAKANNILFI